jgi:hypothetical protein
MQNEFVIKIIIGAVFAGLVGWAVSRLFISVWPRKGKMGINLNEVSCPKCGEVAPKIRKPANLTQVLWGGWTCEKCGCEFNKYGKQVNT